MRRFGTARMLVVEALTSGIAHPIAASGLEPGDVIWEPDTLRWVVLRGRRPPPTVGGVSFSISDTPGGPEEILRFEAHEVAWVQVKR